MIKPESNDCVLIILSWSQRADHLKQFSIKNNCAQSQNPKVDRTRSYAPGMMMMTDMTDPILSDLVQSYLRYFSDAILTIHKFLVAY